MTATPSSTAPCRLPQTAMTRTTHQIRREGRSWSARSSRRISGKRASEKSCIFTEASAGRAPRATRARADGRGAVAGPGSSGADGEQDQRDNVQDELRRDDAHRTRRPPVPQESAHRGPARSAIRRSTPRRTGSRPGSSRLDDLAAEGDRPVGVRPDRHEAGADEDRGDHGEGGPATKGSPRHRLDSRLRGHGRDANEAPPPEVQCDRRASSRRSTRPTRTYGTADSHLPRRQAQLSVTTRREQPHGGHDRRPPATSHATRKRRAATAYMIAGTTHTQ